MFQLHLSERGMRDQCACISTPCFQAPFRLSIDGISEFITQIIGILVLAMVCSHEMIVVLSQNALGVKTVTPLIAFDSDEKSVLT